MPRWFAASVTVMVVVLTAEAGIEAATPAAGNADTDRIVAASRDGGQAAAFALHLAGDIGPRLTGSKALAKAEKWAQDAFERAGLENVHLEPWGVYEAGRRVTGAAKEGLAVHNVVGDLPGSERPDEFVIVGAHLDSWDFARGATDNAAGCGAVMEAARALRASGVRPARTIRFILFTGEEQGLLGAKAYVESHPEVMAKTSAFLNMDMGTNPISGLVGTEAMRADLAAAFAPLASLDASRPFALTTVASLEAPADCGASHAAAGAASCARPCDGPRAKKSCSVGCASDHTAFLRAGVPAFTFQQTGPADYARTHHTEHDTEDALDLEAIRHSAVVLALAAHGIAALPQPLSRTNLVTSAPAGPTPPTGAAIAGGAPQTAPAPCVPSCPTAPR